MGDADTGGHRAWRARALGWLAAAALLVTLGLVVYTGPAFRAGWIEWPQARSMLQWIAYAGIACIPIGLVAAVWNYLRGNRMLATIGVVTLVVGAVLILNLLSWRGAAASFPLIHDITTDTEDPPQFVDVLALRAGAQNPPEYPGAQTAARQRQAYPDIIPIELEVPPGRAFEAASSAASQMGWELVAEVPAEGRIEAVAITRYMGFRDDVVIRVRAAPQGSVVDVRSKSRIGLSDIGTNARRIRSFRERLLGEL